MENRLTPAAVRLCPVVGETLERLRGLGLPCLMSGSGAACFALGAVPAACIPTGGSAWTTAFVPRAAALAPPLLSAR
jgi:hypothetical protein